MTRAAPAAKEINTDTEGVKREAYFVISIAMTTYNGAQYAAEQLRSILEQTQPADEIIICDDGSKDDTVEIIRNVIGEYKTDRVQLIVNEQNQGYIANFHKAISLTHGDFIFLADQDDVWHCDKIEKTMAVMEKTGAAAICTKSRLIDGDGQEISNTAYLISVFLAKLSAELGRISFRDLVIENVAQGCTYCFTKEVKQWYLRVNSSHLVHDYQILLIASLIGDVYAYNQALIDYRIHDKNSVGLQKVGEKRSLNWRNLKKTPERVLFLEDLNREMNVPHFHFYQLVIYLRISRIIAVWNRRRLSRHMKNT